MRRNILEWAGLRQGKWRRVGAVSARNIVALLVTAFASILATGDTLAQAYPNKPIRWIVTYQPGSTGDIFARLLGPKVAEQIGQAVVIENRGSANGNVGTAAGAKAPPDGYTFLLAGNASLSINPHLSAEANYDPVKDFAPVMLIGTAPLLLNAHPSLPAKSLDEFIAYAKANPGKIDFASGGNGSSTHLAGEMLKQTASLDLRHVPYNSSTQAIADLVGGHVMLMFTGVPTTLSQVRSGRLRAVAVAGRTRSAVLPDVPAMAEAVPGFEAVVWYGLLAPAGTPADRVARMYAELQAALKAPDIQEKFKGQGAEVGTLGPVPFAAYIREELVRWGKVVKASGAKLD